MPALSFTEEDFKASEPIKFTESDFAPKPIEFTESDFAAPAEKPATDFSNITPTNQGVFQPSQFGGGMSVMDPASEAPLTIALAEGAGAVAGTVNKFVSEDVMGALEKSMASVGNTADIVNYWLDKATGGTAPYNPTFQAGKPIIPPLSRGDIRVRRILGDSDVLLGAVDELAAQITNMTTPGGVALFASGFGFAKYGGQSGAIANKVAATYFGGEMVSALPEAAQHAVEVIRNPESTDQDKGAAIAGVGGPALLAGLLIKHGSKVEPAIIDRAPVNPAVEKLKQANAPATAEMVEALKIAQEVVATPRGERLVTVDKPPGNAVAKEVAAETGFTLVEKPQAAGAQIPTSEQLDKYTPAEQVMMKELLDKYPPEWEFTDMRPDSPTHGRTFRAPIGSDKATILESYKKSVPEASVTGVVTLKPGEVQTELVGMGAMKEGELNPPTPFKTSNKNATVDAERKARGLEPMMDLERQTRKGAWDEAMQKIDENPQVQDELISELATQARAPTPTENAMLMHRRIDLRNEYEKALHRWREAFEGDDMVRAAEESQRVKDWSSKLSDLEDITKSTGHESSISLSSRKSMAREDFTLAAMELRAMEAKGRHLTPDEHIQLIKAQERITELQRKIDDLESGRESKEVSAQADEILKDVADSAPKEAKSKDFDIDREETLVSGIKAKIEGGKPNEITPLVQQLARVFWRSGIREREPMIDALHGALKTIVPDFTRDQTQRAFSGYGNFKPLSKGEIDIGLRDLRGQTQQVLKLEALEARKPLEKTGQERRVPSDEERRLVKQVNELKRKYGVVVTDPATQLKSALQSRKTYYEHRIADLKHEIETRQRIVKTKSPSPRDAELDAMIAEKDRLQAEHDSIFPKREITDEQRLKLAIAAAERNEAHWVSRLESAKKGIFDTRTNTKKVTSAELEAIKSRTEEIKEHVQELKDLDNPKKTKEEIALQSLKTRMKSRIAEMQDRIARGDFSKRDRKPVALDPEANKIKAELDIVKDEFNTRLERDRWDKLSVFQKTQAGTVDAYDAARAVMTTGEFSFILRQGKVITAARPLITAKALPDTFRALFGNEVKVRELELKVLEDPLAPQARMDKLYLDEHGSKLSRQEEILVGRLVGKIPLVKNFNNAARVFLNKVRFDMWKSMRKSMTKSGTPTPEEGRQIAMSVNEMSGRGGLGKLEPAAVPLARVMFSPRYYASRLQLAAGHSLWGGTMRTRRIIATEHARALIGLGLYYTGLSMYFSDPANDKKGEIEADPRSTDFGKVKIGDTRLDPLAGLSQVIVLAARTATGEKKTNKGKLQDIRGKDVKFGQDQWSDIMARHLRGKLHPVPSSIANLFDGTDLGGDEATVMNQAGNMIAPITYLDIYVALKEQDLEDGTALALLAILGEGLQTFEKKSKSK